MFSTQEVTLAAKDAGALPQSEAVASAAGKPLPVRVQLLQAAGSMQVPLPASQADAGVDTGELVITTSDTQPVSGGRKRVLPLLTSNNNNNKYSLFD